MDAHTDTPAPKKQRGRPADPPEVKAEKQAKKEAEKAAKKSAKAARPSAGHVVEDRRFRLEDLTDEQHLCLVLQHAGKIGAQEVRVAKERDELKKLRDGARAELGKTALHEIKLYRSLETEAGQKALKADMEMRARVGRWGGVQLDIFGDGTDRTPSIDKAFEAGRIAGMAGRDCAPPTELGMPQQQSWLKGWHHGQDVNRNLMLRMSAPPAPTETDAAFDEHAPEDDRKHTVESVFSKDPEAPPPVSEKLVAPTDAFAMGRLARAQGGGCSVPDCLDGEDREEWQNGWRAKDGELSKRYSTAH